MSLSSDDLADIKQLMQAVVSQGNTQLKAELMEEIDRRFDEQDEKLNEILDAVGTDLNKHTAKLDDHDTRITALEKKTA